MENEKLVIKYGSEAVTNEHGMDQELLHQYASDIQVVRETFDVAVVSSGAVATGKALWTPYHDQKNSNEPSLQTYAMMGSGQAFTAWQTALAHFDIPSGQILVTHKEIDDPTEKPVLKRALENCANTGLVPVINENDVLSVEELARLVYGGDNDGLGGLVAELTEAAYYIIFTKKGGLIDDSGDEVRVLTSDMYKWAKKLVSSRERRADSLGRGGMSSKLSICRKTARLGIKTYIAQSGQSIEAVLNGQTGTHVVANET